MSSSDREQVALVTGAAGGIGAASARRFSEEGFSVVVADIDRDGAETVAASITADGGQADAWVVDVSASMRWCSRRRRSQGPGVRGAGGSFR